MKIGIAGPIEIKSLQHHFSNLSDFDLSLGLGGTAVNIIIDGFLKQGHQITVFTLDPQIKDTYILKGRNIKIIFGHFRASAKLKIFDFCYKEFSQIKQFIKKEEASLDIINAHWSYEFAIGSLLTVPKKTVVTFRDDAPSILKLLKHPYRFTRLLMDFWVRKKGKNFTYNSLYLENLIQLKGEIIGNPIFIENLDKPRNHPGQQKEINVFFVANGTDFRKNPDIAIEAFKIIKKNIKQPIKLHFIGKGYANEDAFAKKYTKTEGLVFHGFVAHNKLLEMMKNYDIMVHTSREESFGNNLIEAMAKGIPVVAGENSGAIPWVLNYGDAGILVDIESIEKISNAILSLINNPDLYNQISSAGFDHVSENFTQQSVCSKYINFYNKVINESITHFQ